jgi:predicted nucleotidyltransferase
MTTPLLGIDALADLPDHSDLLDALLGFFRPMHGVVGCFVSGSAASGQMDEDSDLDLGIVFRNAETRSAAWEARWDWPIAHWFHRFDADHIKPHFVIYLFEPAIRADLNLYLVDELPPVEGGPYAIAWDDTGALGDWQGALPAQAVAAPDWRPAVHEDERFWAWLVYLYNHAHRGECYVCAYGFPELRDILEQWAARLAGQARFSPRRLEGTDWGERLLAHDLFPKPERASLKASMLSAIELQLELRSVIAKKGIAWKTSADSIAKITHLVHSL